MEQHDSNRGGTGPMGGAANTPSFGSEPRGAQSPADQRSPMEAGEERGMEAGGAARTETQRELERTRDMLAESAAPVIAEKMQETMSATAQQLRDDPELQEQVKRTASAVQHDAQRMVSEKADEMRGRVEDRVNQGMRQAADGLENAAQRIDQLADQRLGGEGARARAGQMAHTVADTMESMASYLRNNDAQGLRSDLERQVRDRPLETLLMGVAAGWIVGKILR